MIHITIISCHIKKGLFEIGKKEKQGRIHGNPVADGWAGAASSTAKTRKKV